MGSNVDRLWLRLSASFCRVAFSRSIRMSMALEFWRASWVEERELRFLMNLSIVIWCGGAILRRSLRTPAIVSRVTKVSPMKITYALESSDPPQGP